MTYRPRPKTMKELRSLRKKVKAQDYWTERRIREETKELRKQVEKLTAQLARQTAMSAKLRTKCTRLRIACTTPPAKRPWTGAEIKRFKVMWENGMPTPDMARALNRSINSVTGMRERLGLPNRVRGGAGHEQAKRVAK